MRQRTTLLLLLAGAQLGFAFPGAQVARRVFEQVANHSLLAVALRSGPTTPALEDFPADETTLFDSSGKATAYVAEDLTIFLFSGKPVAYLVDDPSGGFHVYGFNGKHIGWFVKGIVRDHQGKAAGTIKEAFSGLTEVEPLKDLKELKPLKSLRELAPLRPLFSQMWSDSPLRFLLLSGADGPETSGVAFVSPPPGFTPGRVRGASRARSAALGAWSTRPIRSSMLGSSSAGDGPGSWKWPQ